MLPSPVAIHLEMSPSPSRLPSMAKKGWMGATPLNPGGLRDLERGGSPPSTRGVYGHWEQAGHPPQRGVYGIWK